MKIGITIDTNMLYSGKSNKILPIEYVLKDFTDYLQALSIAKSKIIPELVLSEIMVAEYLARRQKYLENEYEAFQKSYENLNTAIVGELPANNIEESIQSEKLELARKMPILELKYTASNFKNLVQDAIDKNPPFDKSNSGKKTDAGFKDALIWNTILKSEEIDKYNKFYFASCDKIFEDSEENLKVDFKKHHKNTEIVFITPDSEGEQRQITLRKIITDNELIETTKVKLYNKALLLEGVQQIKYDQKSFADSFEQKGYECPEAINFAGFNEDSFIIEDIEKENKTYSVRLAFETNNYSLKESESTKYKLIGTVILNYETKGRDLKFIKGEIVSLYYLDLAAALLSAASIPVPKLENLLKVPNLPISKFENISKISSPAVSTSGIYQSLLRTLSKDSNND